MPYTDDGTGWQGTDTSLEAAEKMDAATIRQKIINLLSGGDELTADEAGRLIQCGPFSARPRFTELRKAGLIEDTGERRPNGSGRMAVVWRLT